MNTAQMIGSDAQAIVVTTPQNVAVADVRRSIAFCEKLQMKVAGIIENMSGFTCPHCGALVNLFKAGGGEKLAVEMSVPFLGKIPFDPQVVESGDKGMPFVEMYAGSATAEAFDKIVNRLFDEDTKARPDVMK